MRPSGEWEFSEGLSSWEDAPAPAKVGKRLVEGVFQIEIPASRVPLVNNMTHWAFGILGGAQYGIVAGSLRKQKVLYGLPFGASGVGGRIRGPTRRDALQADLGLRRQDAGQGSERPPRLRPDNGYGPPTALALGLWCMSMQ